jgi:hypothetical protein
MSIFEETESYENPEEGTHRAVIAEVVDLGVQPNKYDPDKAPRRRLLLWFELEAVDSKGQRFVVPSWITFTMNSTNSGNPSKLRQIAEKAIPNFDGSKYGSREDFYEDLRGKSLTLVLEPYKTKDGGKERVKAVSFLKSSKDLGISSTYKTRGNPDEEVPI